MRRALFQVHLWIGIALGLYVLLICVSGSALVFRREMDRAFCPGPNGTIACEPAFVTALSEFHDSLFNGRHGRFVNGVGAIAVTVLCVSGAIIWWPGRRYAWRRMTLRRGVSGRKFLRELHHMLGFWLVLFVALWAVSGIYFAFPDPFNSFAELFLAQGEETRISLRIQEGLAWLARLHFGRSFGMTVKVLWAVLGLMPCVLFVTGAVMWWNRVLRPAMVPATSLP